MPHRYFLANLDDDWEYYEMADAVEAEYVPDGNGNYEFIVKVRHKLVTPRRF